MVLQRTAVHNIGGCVLNETKRRTPFKSQISWCFVNDHDFRTAVFDIVQTWGDEEAFVCSLEGVHEDVALRLVNCTISYINNCLNPTR